MEKVKWMFVFLCAFSLLFFAIGCDGGATSSGGCDPTTSSSSSSGSTSSSSGAMDLDWNHSGWQRPNCANCHAEDAHNAGLNPYQCVDCHGTNGARQVAQMHGGNNCRGCHSFVMGHPAASFPYSDSCVACHKN